MWNCHVWDQASSRRDKMTNDHLIILRQQLTVSLRCRKHELPAYHLFYSMPSPCLVTFFDLFSFMSSHYTYLSWNWKYRSSITTSKYIIVYLWVHIAQAIEIEIYLYPIGCPFIQAQKAESTASKCSKILLPIKTNQCSEEVSNK